MKKLYHDTLTLALLFIVIDIIAISLGSSFTLPVILLETIITFCSLMHTKSIVS